MNNLNRIAFLLLLVGTTMLTSCEDYFGEKTDLGFIEIPQQTFREVAYVPVQPILDGYAYPSDVIAGFDELIYVVDRGTEQVIALDESGRELSRLRIPGARAIAQDRRLDLLVIGTKEDNGVDRSCIYRLQLNRPGGYGLRYAVITNEVVHPFYFKTNAISDDANVQFNRIGVMSDNTYYVSRSGPRNNPNQSGGPDDAVLLFSSNDDFLTPVTISNSNGFFRDYFDVPFAISTLAKPPQFSVSQSKDFLFSSLDPNGVLKVQYIENQTSADGSIYTPKTNWSNDTSQASTFINEPFKFEEPVGIEYDADDRQFIFVVDRAKDSLYQFTSNGLEGVEPPPASNEKKHIRSSFGGTGVGPTQFDEPMAVAYKDDILYVADAGNGRVLRFKLTLDIR